MVTIDVFNRRILDRVRVFPIGYNQIFSRTTGHIPKYSHRSYYFAVRRSVLRSS